MLDAQEQKRLREGMKRVPPASWHGFREIIKNWRLDKEDAGALLLLGKLHMIGSWNLHNEMFLAPEQLDRLSYLLAINFELNRLSADPLVIMRWLHLPRRAGKFVGQTPFSAMCRSDDAGLGAMVLELMDSKNLLDLF